MQKKDLIESKKIICLKNFLWFKEMTYSNSIKFVWFNKISDLNQYIISLTIYQCINLIVLKKIVCFKQIFIRSKDILFELNKFYFIQINNFLKSKKIFQKNNFFWFNQIFFLSVHSEKIYDWIKQNYLFETLSLM